MSYINGNYIVNHIRKGGVKKRLLRRGEVPEPEFPDSIDLKLTNLCSESCPFCHENSVPGGGSFNLDETKRVLSDLPEVGIELALGGGNLLECPQSDLVEFCSWATERGFLVRATFKYEHLLDTFRQYYDKDGGYVSIPRDHILSSIHYIGSSIVGYVENPFSGMVGERYERFTLVWHIIAGVTSAEDLLKFWKDPVNYNNILVLGFKNYGRATNMSPNLKGWREAIKSILEDNLSETCKTLAFDNLAIEQLGIKDLLSKDDWTSHWMGPEFSTSMYVDAVNQTYAPTSRSLVRTPWNQVGSIVEYFKANRNAYTD